MKASLILRPFVGTKSDAQHGTAPQRQTRCETWQSPHGRPAMFETWRGRTLRRCLGIGLCLFSLHLTVAPAQDLTPGTTWLYQLTEGSQIIDDCPICDRLPIVEPIRGTFELRLLQQNPLFTDYAIENLWFTNASATGRTYRLAGRGVLEIGGEIAVRQSLFLNVYIYNGITNDPVLLTTNSTGVTRLWPMVQIDADQTNGTLVQQYHLDLNAAPLREMWFSTTEDFTAGIWGTPTNLVSRGDLLSIQGRRVRSNAQLARLLGVMPPVPDLGLKDFDLRAGGEIAFSFNEAVWSETLGRLLLPGDLLSDQGLVLRSNQGLIAAFNPETVPAEGVGLMAVQTMVNGETWFSVATNFFSKSLGTTVMPGDLLSDAGAVVRGNAQLLSRFKPTDPATNAGLTAVYVWPSAEIWFCTATAFSGANAAHYDAGDLLSDQGYVVYRNAELLAAFAPLKTNAPLDGLWLVTDTIPMHAPPVMRSPRPLNQPPTSFAFTWQGEGQVFQLERSTNVGGPYLPAGPIVPDTAAVDNATLDAPGSRFYRVRQW
ncbi:MAG TPA: hypothetical protein VJA21_00365 [Verrucomicrobiae bacterium]